MAKSRTRKKQSKPLPPMPPDARQQVDAVADYIKDWTYRELAKLQHKERKPICIPTNRGYKIGLYSLEMNPNKTCDLYDANKDLVHTFDSKVNAVLYTLYTIKNFLNKAQEIIELDSEINKHYADIKALQHRQNVAKTRKEYDIVDIRAARLDIITQKLDLAKNKLLKIRLHAKYNKVWMD